MTRPDVARRNRERKAVAVRVGDAFANWTVVGLAGHDLYGRERFRVRCTCGAERVTERWNLVNAKTRWCSRCVPPPATRGGSRDPGLTTPPGGRKVDP